MFEHFTESSIRVIMLAQEEARRLGHNFVGTEQILLGLIGESHGPAIHSLRAFGITLAGARREVERIIGRGSGFVAVEIPFTPRAKRALENAWTFSRDACATSVDTNHLLLGLLKEEDGVAIAVLRNLDVNIDSLRLHVLDPKREPQAADKATPQPPADVTFEKFGDEAIRIVMRAQEVALNKHFRFVDTDTLLYGILAEGNSEAAKLLQECDFTVDGVLSAIDALTEKRQANLVADEIKFSAGARLVLAAAKQLRAGTDSELVESRHLLYPILAQLRYPGTAEKVEAAWKKFGVSVSKVEQTYERLAARFGPLEPEQVSVMTPLSSTAARRPPKTLSEWFTPAAIQILAAAEERARAAGQALVVPDHLLPELVAALKWAPPQIVAYVKKLGPAPTSANVALQTEVMFSPEVLAAFVASRAEASHLGSESVAPEHLLLGLLKTVDYEGAGAALYNQATKAVYDHMRQGVDGAESTPQPLMSGELVVRATARLKATIKRAGRNARASNRVVVTTADLLLALLDESADVKFVQERSKALELVRDNLGAEPGPSAAPDQLPGDQVVIILQRAILEAQRLCSNALDINHLALALLQEESKYPALVNAALINAPNGRAVLKRRLECCVLWSNSAVSVERVIPESLDLENIDALLAED